MILSFSFQAVVFASAVACGIVLGFFYDIIRIIRIAFKHKKIFVHIEDGVYWLFAAFAAFWVMLYINNGEIRPFVIFGAFLGMIFYFSFPSVIIIGVADKIISTAKAIIRAVLKPICKILRIASLPVKKIINFLCKKAKKCLHLCKLCAKLKIGRFVRMTKTIAKK